MRIDLRTWAIAASLAVLSAVGALYLTRPASPALMTGSHQMAGRDYPSFDAPGTVSSAGGRLAR